MARKINWEDQIGRRLKLRDLHVLSTVAQRGSMAKAAAHLGVSQPAVSEIISDLEHALGVRLLDRSQRGVEPTIYGRVLIERTQAAFDELKQGIQTIEHLVDPSVGEVRIGCSESLVSAILAPVIPSFSLRYPRVRLHVEDVLHSTPDMPELRSRKLDIILIRPLKLREAPDDEFETELLVDDEMVVAAGARNRWARRRAVDVAELVQEPWILPPRNSWNYKTVEQALQARGFSMPEVCVTTFSVHLRNDLLATGRFVTAYPKSFMRVNGDRFGLKILPVDLPMKAWPIEIITLKHRTPNPAVQRFIEHVRDFAKSIAEESKNEKQSA